MSAQSIIERDIYTYRKKYEQGFLDISDKWLLKHRFGIGDYPSTLEFMFYEHMTEILDSCNDCLEYKIEQQLKFKPEEKCIANIMKRCMKCRPCNTNQKCETSTGANCDEYIEVLFTDRDQENFYYNGGKDCDGNWIITRTEKGNIVNEKQADKTNNAGDFTLQTAWDNRLTLNYT